MNKSVILLSLFLLVACNDHLAIAKGEQLCLNDKGLKRLAYPGYAYEVHVHCSNGRRIIISYKNFDEINVDVVAEDLNKDKEETEE